MATLIQALDELLDEINDTSYEPKEKKDYICSVNYQFNNFINLSIADILELYVIASEDLKVSIVQDKISLIREDLQGLLTYEDIYTAFTQIALYIDKIELLPIEINPNNCTKLYNSINFSKPLTLFFNKIFTGEGTIYYQKCLTFLSIFNSNNLPALTNLILEVIKLHEAQKTIDQQEGRKRAYVMNSLMEKIKSFFPTILNIVEVTDQLKNLLMVDEKTFNKEKNKLRNIITEIKSKVENDQYIDIIKYKDSIDHDLKLNCTIHNNMIMIDEMEKQINIRKNINISNINNLEYFIKKNGFALNIDNIEENENSLKILNIIKDKFTFIKEYTNILEYILNYSDVSLLNTLYKVLKDYNIDETFILNNYLNIFNSTTFSNFLENCVLLNSVNISVSNLLNTNPNIIFLDKEKIKSLIVVYKQYNLDLSSNTKSYDFLLNDYSYIIDAFIEIGEYDLIKNNISLLNKDSLHIIDRILLSKELNNNYKNEAGKLIGSIRSEDKFIVNNKMLNEIQIKNYEDYMDEEVNILLLTNVIEQKEVRVNLDNYLINNYTYKIGNILISKKKVSKNMFILLNSDANLSYEEMLFNSIIYKYPKYLSDDDVKNLYRELNIKRKLKELN